MYELVGQRWADQGTAFCSGHYDETTGEAALIARSENDFKSVILSTTIRSADVYQRQQDTLIVWTEPTGVDFALSFQDPEGCAEVWSFIREVQPHIPGDGASHLFMEAVFLFERHHAQTTLHWSRHPSSALALSLR